MVCCHWELEKAYALQYGSMVERKASGLKGLELTDCQAAKVIAVQQALMAINNEQDNHHLTDTEDHYGAVHHATWFNQSCRTSA